MTELKNTERELHLFRLRLTVLGGMVFLCFALLLARFVWLQIVKHSDYAAQAEDNRIAVVPIVPNRGLILDRNGVVLARNYSAYTLEVTPSKLNATLDETIDDLSHLITIEVKDRKRFKKLLEESKNFESVPLRTRLSDEEVARFTAQRFRFPGVEIQARLFRQYPLGEIASHVIGFIGRINQSEAKAIDDTDDAANYSGTDHIGKEGLEKSYEKQLHGTTGYEEVEVSAGGRAGQQPDPVDRHRAAKSGRGSLRRLARRAGGDRAEHRRHPRLCFQARLRSQPVRRRHRRAKLERPE